MRLSLCPAPPAALPLSGPAALPRAGRRWRQPRAAGALLFSSSCPKAPVAVPPPAKGCQHLSSIPACSPKPGDSPFTAQCCTPNHPLGTAWQCHPLCSPSLLLPGGVGCLGDCGQGGAGEAGVRGQPGAGLSVCRAPCAAINLKRAAAAPAKNHIRCVWQRLDM